MIRVWHYSTYIYILVYVCSDILCIIASKAHLRYHQVVLYFSIKVPLEKKKHISFQWPLAPHQRHCELVTHSESEPGFFQFRKLFIFPSDLPPFLLIILPLPLASVLFQSTVGVGLAEAVAGWLQHHTKHGHLLVVQWFTVHIMN